MKLFGSRRTKQREVIKKQNGMSHLIDTELSRGNRKGEESRRRRREGETKCKEKKVHLVYVGVCLCVHMTECISACACVYCVCIHMKGL